MCQKNDWLHGTQGKDVSFVSIPMYQYSNYINNNNNKKTTPVIKHVSCGYSCCCSVGRLVVTPPISRSSRSGLSSHVSFRSLVLTWCVRGEGENGRWLWYDIYDLWFVIATSFENENDSCKKRPYLPLRCYYKKASQLLEWGGSPLSWSPKCKWLGLVHIKWMCLMQ